MKINDSKFITSAANKNQYPKDNRMEIAFVGRSNVGKSSLINYLVNRKKLALTSSLPGKTRLINFFLINNEFYFVDLPGYGYAKVSKNMKKNWGKIIETYMTNRKNLKKVVLLLDSRRVPNDDDMLMLNWINYYNYTPIIVLTKIDKLTRKELNKNVKVIKERLNLNNETKVILSSTLKKIGREEILKSIFEY